MILTPRFVAVILVFMGLLFVPQMLLSMAGSYPTKLRIDPALDGEFAFGVLLALAFAAMFMLAAYWSGICRVSLAENILALEDRASFRVLAVALAADRVQGSAVSGGADGDVFSYDRAYGDPPQTCALGAGWIGAFAALLHHTHGAACGDAAGSSLFTHPQLA